MIVGISIVNYKTADLTIQCLHSLVAERRNIDFEVLVVDNDSGDGSFEKLSAAVISEGWANWVRIIDSKRNGGFAFGNNIAIRQFSDLKDSPEFIYLLNPDTYICPDAVNELVTFMQQNPKVGITGSRIEDPEGIPQASSFKFHTFFTEMDRGFSLGLLTRLLGARVDPYIIGDNKEKTDWVSGASMMIRQSVFDQVGLLDEAYFMYYEETDFCLQAARANWECWYIPESRVVHYVGQSSGITNSETMLKRMPTYWFDSRRRFFLKNHGILHAILADFFWLIGFFSWNIRNLVQNKENNNPPNFLWDSLVNSIFIRGFNIAPIKNK